MPPFWFRRKRRKKTSGIPKLVGNPFSNIPRWLYERTKRIKTNPLNKSQTTKTKDKKIHVPSLQTTLMRLVSTVNQVIDEINKIPPIEARMDRLEKKHAKDTKAMTAAIAAHATNAQKHGAAGGSSNQSSTQQYKTGGKVEKP